MSVPKISLLLSLVVLAGCQSIPEPGDYYAYSNPEGWLVADNGCKVNRYYVGDAVQASWSGDCIDGFAIGKGQLKWTQADGSQAFWSTCLQPEHPRAFCSLGGGGLH